MTDTVRTAYRELSDAEKERVAAIKSCGQEFLDILTECVANRELSLAKTKVEEAVMWAVKGVTG
jgi:hypothetical protein